MKKNNKDPKDLAIYQEMAKYGEKAFSYVICNPGTYSVREIEKKLWREMFFDGDFDAEELCQIEVGTFRCTFQLGRVFDIMAKFATSCKIPSAKRISFTKEAKTEGPVETVAETMAEKPAKDSTKELPFVEYETLSGTRIVCRLLSEANGKARLLTKGHNKWTVPAERVSPTSSTRFSFPEWLCQGTAISNGEETVIIAEIGRTRAKVSHPGSDCWNELPIRDVLAAYRPVEMPTEKPRPKFIVRLMQTVRKAVAVFL